MVWFSKVPYRAGKTSIQRVVFHKMSPHETLFLDPTGVGAGVGGVGSLPPALAGGSLVVGSAQAPNSMVNASAGGGNGVMGQGNGGGPADGLATATNLGSQRPEITLIANNPLVQFEIWDLPGDFDFIGTSATLLNGRSLVFLGMQ